MEGLLPSKGGVEPKAEAKLPDFIPDKAIFPIRTQDDVDDLPRGAVAHLMEWDEELAFDLVVSGAAFTLIDRATKERLESHEDFDASDFGVIDDEGLWLPGVEAPYERADGGWRRLDEEE